MTIQLKKDYNKLLERYKNGEAYFENKNVSMEDKEKQIKNFQLIMGELSHLLTKIKDYTDENVLGGFEV